VSVDSRTYGTCTILTGRLPALLAMHMVPDVAKIATAFVAGQQSGLVEFDALNLALQHLDGDKWVSMLVRGLSATQITVAGAGKIDLSSKEGVERALTEQPQLLFPLLKAVWEVSFAKYFFGLASIGLLTPKDSRTEDSSPSTSNSGPSTGSG
jgi:hypothetical protein